MTPADYRTAIATLGLSQLAAGRWLGVSPKTAQRYAVDGPSPGAAKAIQVAVLLRGKARFYARQADQAIDSGLRDERRHTADALESMCHEAMIPLDSPNTK